MLKDIQSEVKTLTDISFEYIVVDSNSTDGTTEWCVKEARQNQRIHLHKTARGIGRAIREGLSIAFKDFHADLAIEMDADLSHNPSDIKRLLKEAEEGYELILGSRFVRGGKNNLPFQRRFLSRMANYTVRLLMGIMQINEFTNNFRCTTRGLYNRLNMNKLNFEDNTFLPAYVYEAFRINAKVKEIPIVFNDRLYGSSKINVLQYSPNLLRYALKKFIDRLMQPKILMLVALLFIAGFFRLYQLDKTTWIGGDEGRDLLVIENIINSKKPLLQGPPTSIVTQIGRMYYGPGFYYMVMPLFILLGGHPASGAYLVAILGIGSVVLLYLLLEKLAGNIAAFTGALLYATAPLVISYDRWFWSPNPVPFFILLIMYSFIKIYLDKKDKYLILIGVAIGLMWQLHYTSLFFLIPLVFWLFYFKIKVKVKIWMYALIGFIIPSSPLLISELRHGLPNVKVFLYYLLKEPKHSLGIFDRITNIYEWVYNLFITTINSYYLPIGIILVIAATVLLVYLILGRSQTPNHRILGIISSTWVLFSLVPHLSYTGEFPFDFRFILFLIPMPFILIGLVVQFAWNRQNAGKFVGLCILLYLIIGNFMDLGVFSSGKLFQYDKGSTLYNKIRAVDYIIADANGEPYTLSVDGSSYDKNGYIYITHYKNNPITGNANRNYKISYIDKNTSEFNTFGGIRVERDQVEKSAQ